jgi:hypothetical protein
MTEAVPADKLVAAYRRIRTTIEEKEEAHKTEIKALKEKLDLISEHLLQLCNDQNVDSLRTAQGTATRTVRSRYWTTDWDSMYRIIREQDVPFLLEQRIHNGNMKQFLEENPELHPPGLQEDRKYVITVRKPTNR